MEENKSGIFDAIYIPESDNSGDPGSDSENFDSDFYSEETSNVDHEFSIISQKKVLKNYEAEQDILEPDYEYSWVSEERNYKVCVENVNMPPERTKKVLRELSYIQLFELFFSKNIKDYIIERTPENGFFMSLKELDVFVGILVLLIFNRRKG